MQLINLNDALKEEKSFTEQEAATSCYMITHGHMLLRQRSRSSLRWTRNFSRMWRIYKASDYRLFQAIQHHLADTYFRTEEEVRKNIDNFIASKPASFYHLEIRKLLEGWQMIIDNKFIR
ncbi:uncharacterized protein LOC116844687 [Odontomachus brunneus]|uniref:uncharacterized protein LOC116844687 n=1 Tax=Odontomachus brunneus TaxID=486640 RepID=UPI0013F18924|nr:uncharacterized protein LOC116844687 [Odontomachus brunneus]XP_032672452.1 uncharacterized protein LOC116844687 [Odontomachus brunneus]